MKKIRVQKLGINKFAIDRKINPGGPVSGGDCGSFCGSDGGCPSVCGGHEGCPAVCYGEGCPTDCGGVSGRGAKGNLVSNPARKMNIARVRKVR